MTRIRLRLESFARLAKTALLSPAAKARDCESPNCNRLASAQKSDYISTHASEIMLRDLAAHTKSATSLETLNGIEGAGAREYFGAWSTLLPDGWRFDNRNRQPPVEVRGGGCATLGWIAIIAGRWRQK